MLSINVQQQQQPLNSNKKDTYCVGIGTSTIT